MRYSRESFFGSLVDSSLTSSQYDGSLCERWSWSQAALEPPMECSFHLFKPRAYVSCSLFVSTSGQSLLEPSAKHFARGLVNVNWPRGRAPTELRTSFASRSSGESKHAAHCHLYSFLCCCVHALSQSLCVVIYWLEGVAMQVCSSASFNRRSASSSDFPCSYYCHCFRGLQKYCTSPCYSVPSAYLAWFSHWQSSQTVAANGHSAASKRLFWASRSCLGAPRTTFAIILLSFIEN